MREDFGTTRIDANLSQNDLLFGVYTIDDSDATTPSANPYSAIYESLREQVASVQEQHVFSPHLLNTFRFGYSRASFFFNGIVPDSVPGWVTGAPVGSIVISGSTASNGSSQITLAGANTGSNNATTRNLFTVDDHIYWTHGRHQIEAGIWLQRLQSNDFLAQNQYGQASFSTLAAFEQGTVSKYTIVPGPTELGWRSLFAAGFIEDAWKATPRLEVRGGIRFESSTGWNEAQGRASNYGFTNGVINTNPTVGSSALFDNRAKFMPEPRVAIAWDVFGNGKTAVKGSFGLHRALLDTLDYRLDQTAPFNATLSYSNTAVSKLPDLSTAAATGGLVSPSNVQPDIQTPTVLAWTARVEQQIAPRTSLTVGYIGSHGYHQILSEDQNTPPWVVCPAASCPASLPAGTIYYTTTKLANPQLANTTSWVSQGVSNYNALEVDVRRQYGNGSAVARRLHMVEEPRRWLGLEHQRLRQHTGLRFVSRQSKGRLRARRHEHQPDRGDQRHLGAAPWPGPRMAQQCVVGGPAVRLGMDAERHRIHTERLPILSAARLQPHGQWRHPQPGPPIAQSRL